ncbi:MAG: YggT family protein [Defluviitaleaceae bacterium]|nr:YggT family protein [Defluviitaleaceae bacterium]
MISNLADAVNAFFMILRILLFARIILSWFAMGRGNPLMDLLFALTEPVLAPIRKLVNRSPLGGPGMIIDFSPLIALVLLQLANNVIINLLAGM